jgi:DNA polymerase elongation subunit (family B)
MTNPQKVSGQLFDIYLVDDLVHLWIIDNKGKAHLLYDRFNPVIYIWGSPHMQSRFIGRLKRLGALAGTPRLVDKKLFYTDQLVSALELKLSGVFYLQKIHQKIYAFYEKLQVYHTDIDPAVSYMLSKNIFPLAPIVLSHNNQWILNIRPLGKITDFDYDLPDLVTMEIRLAGEHRLGLSTQNPLLIKCNDNQHELVPLNKSKFLNHFNQLILDFNPDVILSTFGDQVIFPTLLKWSQEYNIPLHIDRDPTLTSRKIKTQGTSFNTYGSWIFRAPSYPLFGRWHIDSANSFVYKETELIGILELARLSSTPVQRIARSSTGSALSNLETSHALKMNYLIPWQKSAIERPKTALTLLSVDKGGLVYQPGINDGFVKEQVAQLDFKQMYPSLMVRFNISPETVNCRCCEPAYAQSVPFTPYTICQKREGVVSSALHHVLQRRAYYKKQKKTCTGKDFTYCEARQRALKWMLVTSFGYLGYRNAKFGKLESHECVTAYGRDVLLRAKEIAEQQNYSLSHAITDSIFIHLPGYQALDSTSLNQLCQEIEHHTEVGIDIEGIYSWLIYLPSKIDLNRPVANRYLGRFTTGEIKQRGIFARRKDIPLWIREFQLKLLDVMAKCSSVAQLRQSFEQAMELYELSMKQLQSNQVEPQDLLVRKTVSKDLTEYQVNNATKRSLSQLKQEDIQVQAGEKIQYLVLHSIDQKENKIIAAEQLKDHPGKVIPCKRYYGKLLKQAFEELYQCLAPTKSFFDNYEQPTLFR